MSIALWVFKGNKWTGGLLLTGQLNLGVLLSEQGAGGVVTPGREGRLLQRPSACKNRPFLHVNPYLTFPGPDSLLMLFLNIREMGKHINRLASLFLIPKSPLTVIVGYGHHSA